MADERDLVVFEDDEGNELTMEVLDYFYYEGNEYAILAEPEEEEHDENEHYQRDAFVMQVVDAGDDMEEFVPVDDALAEKLIELVQNGMFDDDELEDDE